MGGVGRDVTINPIRTRRARFAPKYLTDGLPKQDRETFEDVREYIEALFNYHALLDEQPIDESYLPEDAGLVEETPKGSIMNEFRTCGDESCHCMSGGEKHGPYRYRVHREEGEVKRGILGSPSNAQKSVDRPYRAFSFFLAERR